MSDFEWVDEASQLEALGERMRRAEHLALDSESNSMFAYRERVCLIQLAIDDAVVMIDPFAMPAGPEGIEPLRAALEDAGLTPSDIAYVNLHGTGTVQNDAMESLAVKTVFGEVPCSSTKPLTGHTLGAAGAIELGLCWEMFERDGATYQLPVHHWDGEVDPAIEKVSLVTRATSELSRENRRYVLSNSFAFGGNNCSLILGARV